MKVWEYYRPTLYIWVGWRRSIWIQKYKYSIWKVLEDQSFFG